MSSLLQSHLLFKLIIFLTNLTLLFLFFVVSLVFSHCCESTSLWPFTLSPCTEVRMVRDSSLCFTIYQYLNSELQHVRACSGMQSVLPSSGTNLVSLCYIQLFFFFIIIFMFLTCLSFFFGYFLVGTHDNCSQICAPAPPDGDLWTSSFPAAMWRGSPEERV